MAKMLMSAIFGMFLPFLSPLQAVKLYKNIFSLVEEVLSFDLVGHM